MQLRYNREIAEQRIRLETEKTQVESEARIKIAESASHTNTL